MILEIFPFSLADWSGVRMFWDSLSLEAFLFDLFILLESSISFSFPFGLSYLQMQKRIIIVFRFKKRILSMAFWNLFKSPSSKVLFLVLSFISAVLQNTHDFEKVVLSRHISVQMVHFCYNLKCLLSLRFHPHPTSDLLRIGRYMSQNNL